MHSIQASSDKVVDNANGHHATDKIQSKRGAEAHQIDNIEFHERLVVCLANSVLCLQMMVYTKQQ